MRERFSLVQPVIAILFGFACASAPAQNLPTQEVVLDAVQLSTAAPKVWVPATVLSRTDARLGTEVSGRVLWVAQPGTLLAKGDKVAQLAGELWEIAAEDSAANVKRLEAQLDYLRSDAERLGKLVEVNSAAQSQLEKSVAEREMAIQELNRAQAEHQRANHHLRRTNITTPFSGQVVERLAQAGEYLSIGEEVARVVDLADLEVRAQAPLRVAPFVQLGGTLPVQRGDTAASKERRSTHQAKVTAVIPVADLTSRTFEIRLEAPDTDWVIGSSARLGLPGAGQRSVLTVHRDALVLREGGTAVFVVRDGKAHRLTVETGIGIEERIELKSADLTAGEAVVIRGAETLRDGQPVVRQTTTSDTATKGATQGP